MNEPAERIESIVDALAVGLLGLAVASAMGILGWPIAAAACGGGAASLLGGVALRAVRPDAQDFRLAQFAVPEIETVDELVLTDADRLHPDVAGPDELLLDDILVQLQPDSRVVRLFDAAAMPTPGQLKARIDRHLGDGATTAGLADASEALHEALAELRRSLR